MIGYETTTEYRVRVSVEERRVTTYDHGKTKRSRWVKTGIDWPERRGENLADALVLFDELKDTINKSSRPAADRPTT